MPRPKLEPHLQRLLNDERTYVGALFQVNDGGPWWCSLYAPVQEGVCPVLDPSISYAYDEGPTPEDAIYGARDKLWNGL